jgi:hypothetical protein
MLVCTNFLTTLRAHIYTLETLLLTNHDSYIEGSDDTLRRGGGELGVLKTKAKLPHMKTYFNFYLNVI